MSQQPPKSKQRKPSALSRQGAIAVLTGFALVIVFAFVAFSVDTGHVVLTGAHMQNAVDAAALAASQEITVAAQDAAAEGGTGGSATQAAVAVARQMAADVAEANGVYVNPDTDVQFGARYYDAATGTWSVQWGLSPYNTVRVTARRTESDSTAPDGEVRLAFGWAVGRPQVPIQASAVAYVEARDLVVCLDWSSSMNDDSSIKSFSSLGQANTEAALDSMWDALVAADPKWPNTTISKFSATGLGKVDSYFGTYVPYNSSRTVIYEALQLDQPDGNGNSYVPFPQAGRSSSGNGLPKSMPNETDSRNMWKYYIAYVRDNEKNRSAYDNDYKYRYGYRSLMDYLQEKKYRVKYSEDLWRTPHYPFHACKEGTTLLLDFMNNLEFGDEVGLVVYYASSKELTQYDDGEVSIDISADPITGDYATLDVLHRRHQTAHWGGGTGMGYGIKSSRIMLDDHRRYGTRPTMLIMTDGRTNKKPSGWSLPSGFDWDDWTDFDGDGIANYTTSNSYKQYAFWEATEAIKGGVTIHTMAVGAGADPDIMKAIAFAGGGIFVDIPGGSTIADLETQVLDAFNQIASKVPPARLVYDLSN
jgi:Flp pilus assembly protein TadG